MPTISGTLLAIDNLPEADLPGFLSNRGSFRGINSRHQAPLSGKTTSFRTILGVNRPHQASLSGVLVGDTTTTASDATFLQGSYLNSDSLTLSLRDGTVVGWTQVDGTYVDGTYIERGFNPVWLNYSIWYLTPTTGVPKQIQGYGLRLAINPQVGQFYANMYAPDQPGKYELRWRWQKTDGAYAHEVIVPFTTVSLGIKSQPDYTGGV